MILARQLRVPQPLREQVWQALAAVYPHEGCGLIGGDHDATGWHITECAMTTNASSQAARQFEIDGLWYARTEKAWAERGITVLGVVHSHPDCPPIPSETDRLYATNWPGFVWWIVRVDDRQPTAHRAWLLGADERFTELEVDA